MGPVIMLLPVLIPIVCGIILGCITPKNRTSLCTYVFVVLALALVGTVAVFCTPEAELDLTLCYITDELPIYFHADFLSKLFSLLMSFVWLMAGMVAFEYMQHEHNEKRFFCFYLIVGGILVALGYSGNLITLYMFYELMTFTSVPLVLHTLTPEAISAGFKYLFYSIGGAFLMLFGFFVLASYGVDTTFVAGGTIAGTSLAAYVQTPILMVSIFLMIVGFGTKAGMFPMHGWLPTAHPIAPAPASAVLSGAITKAGVLGIIRVVFYVVGADSIRGTWVQYAWAGLALFTVLMGSTLAYRENVLKKRLAYSTVSQVSYVLFGLSVLQPIAFVGAILHIIFHSLVKNTLFLSAGAIIYKTGKTKVDQLKGIGLEMPAVLWCFMIASVTLIGIPPTSAFLSKWYLASGALSSGTQIISWLGPVILLVSAILTAGYLFPIVLSGFFPGQDFDASGLSKKDPTWLMLAPLGILSALCVLLGIFSSGLIGELSIVAAAIMG